MSDKKENLNIEEKTLTDNVLDILEQVSLRSARDSSNGDESENQAQSNGKTGKVLVLKDGIITVSGLAGVKSGEIVWVQTNVSTSKQNNNSSTENQLRALVLTLNRFNVQAILLGSEKLVNQGALVRRTSSLFRLSCTLGLFGKVLDGLGIPRLNSVVLEETRILVEQKATGIIDREPVRIPLRTGIKSVDSLVPIGRGQRELIIGDRQTGKTSVGADTIINHVSLNENYRYVRNASRLSDLRQVVWFIYNAIGQKQSTVSQLWTILGNKNATWFTSVVAATAAEPAPLQFLSPYTACTLGEYIRDIIGGHCVLIYDDLSKHAVAYRQMSLLLRRPPGREAFPGDVFYVHSRLLERAGSLTTKELSKGTFQVRGTLTAFPVIETQAGDVSAYIPTNVISITDGQIFLETELFYKGVRPAINVGLSVSRVGSAAQPALVKKVAGSLKMELAQFRELESFSKLGASLDENTQRLLQRGENIIEVLKQGLNSPLSTLEEVLSIYLSVGFSGKWASDVLKTVNSQKDFKFSLNSPYRIKFSWLELFRSLAPEFKITFVNKFLSSFLIFVRTLGFTALQNYVSVESLTVKFLNLHPLFLIEDLVVLFLTQANVLTPTGKDLHISKLYFTENNSGLFSVFTFLSTSIIDKVYTLNKYLCSDSINGVVLDTKKTVYTSLRKLYTKVLSIVKTKRGLLKDKISKFYVKISKLFFKKVINKRGSNFQKLSKVKFQSQLNLLSILVNLGSFLSKVFSNNNKILLRNFISTFTAQDLCRNFDNLFFFKQQFVKWLSYNAWVNLSYKISNNFCVYSDKSESFLWSKADAILNCLSLYAFFSFVCLPKNVGKS